MTHNAHLSCDIKNLRENSKTTLPNENTTQITSVDKVNISAQIILQGVLYVPEFKYNLLSIPRLIKDSHCIVIFHPRFCIIQDYVTKRIMVIGGEHRGLYYLKDQPLKGVDSRMENIIKDLLQAYATHVSVAGAASYSNRANSYEVWHKRLGHAPLSKLRYISSISLKADNHRVCVTCPMSKLARQPFHSSMSKSAKVCELIHMDIWGPYRVPTHRQFKYFLTLVDDCT